MAAELKAHTGVISKLTPGGKGVFDVVVDGKAIFSKSSLGRFPKKDEVASLFKRDR